MKITYKIILSVTLLLAFISSAFAFSKDDYLKWFVEGMNELDIEKVETNIDKWVSAGFLTQEEWEKYKDEYRVEIEQKIAASLPWTFTQTDYTNGLIEWMEKWDIEIIKEAVNKAIDAWLMTKEKGQIVVDGYTYKIARNKNLWKETSLGSVELKAIKWQAESKKATKEYEIKKLEKALRSNKWSLAEYEQRTGEKYVFIYDENGEKIDTSSDTEKVLEVMAPIIQEVYQDPNIYISQLSDKQQVQFQTIRTRLQKVLSGNFLDKLNSYSQEKKDSTITTVLEKAEKLKNSTSNMYKKAIYEEVIIQIWELK